ncbi:magnesium/cobalt transporter CorA [Embleya sp. NBC_00896]|uniref:magnesium/cobalt transporter CorA n=1 Tax=Embleya sp. NBC_00896 TaxID=2975961 RepID=UPI002F90FD33|nr:magnesium/cobalt transporter CorA [Embleya sp. NBC_00896]
MGARRTTRRLLHRVGGHKRVRADLERRPVVVDCALYDKGVRRPGEVALDEALDAAEAGAGTFVWIGLHAPRTEDLAEIATAFDLHPLAVEDAVNAHQRPKLEHYDDTLFLVLKTIVYVEHDALTATSEVVDTGEIMVFAGEKFVVVVRHGSAPPLTELRRSLEADPEMLARGPAAVVHAIADRVVDDYLRVSDKIDEDFEKLEEDVFSTRRTNDAESIYQLKRELIEFKRAVLPLGRPLEQLMGGGLPGMDGDFDAYLRDVADHLAQVRERLASHAELLDGILSASHAQVTVQQNTDMRKIASIAAILAVPTLLVGIYGMNFDHMPELQWTYGYPAVLAGMVTISVLMFRAFRRNGWL